MKLHGKIIIECDDINTLRDILRRLGCKEEKRLGWFYNGRKPLGIYHNANSGLWYSIIENAERPN